MENTNVKVQVNQDLLYLAKISALEKMISQKDAEIERLNKLTDGNVLNVSSDDTHNKSYKKHEVSPENNAYSDYKSNGVRKAHAADPIRSYDDFKAIQNYFLKTKHNIRDWALWTVGVCMGIRISDLLALKFKNVLDERGEIRDRVKIYEQKTGKINNILITEAAADALTKYLNSLKWKYDPDGYLFYSKKTGGKLYEECGWRIIAQAGKYLKLPLNIGSHTMRKSFANIAACVDKSVIDMNSITKIQGLLNHSDAKTTMRYLDTYSSMYDRARKAVSDFVLGKTDVNEIVAGSQHSLDDVYDLIDQFIQGVSGN